MSKIITTTSLQAFMSQNGTLVASVAQQVVNSVNQWIETRTNRAWGELVTVTERYDWAPLIWLRHQDIDITADTMTIQLGYPHLLQSPLDSTSFFWNEWGRVTMYLQSPGQFNISAVNNDLVEITYNYGVVDVPDDLVMAALGIAAGFYNWAVNGQKDIVSASVGTYRLEYLGRVRQTPAAGVAPDISLNTAQANWAIVDSYTMVKQ